MSRRPPPAFDGAGAFIAGLLLAETEFRKAIETTIGPFKGLLLGVLFFTVGMNIDVRELARQPLLLLASRRRPDRHQVPPAVGLARIFRLPWPAAIETGLLLGPGGEFAFVGIGLATSLGLIGADVSSFTLTVTSITMALIPVAVAGGAAFGAEIPTSPRRSTPNSPSRRPAATDMPSSSAMAGSDRSSAHAGSARLSLSRRRQ